MSTIVILFNKASCILQSVEALKEIPYVIYVYFYIIESLFGEIIEFQNNEGVRGGGCSGELGSGELA